MINFCVSVVLESCNTTAIYELPVASYFHGSWHYKLNNLKLYNVKCGQKRAEDDDVLYFAFENLDMF
jgi:hypothetical protein